MNQRDYRKMMRILSKRRMTDQEVIDMAKCKNCKKEAAGSGSALCGPCLGDWQVKYKEFCANYDGSQLKARLNALDVSFGQGR